LVQPFQSLSYPFSFSYLIQPILSSIEPDDQNRIEKIDFIASVMNEKKGLDTLFSFLEKSTDHVLDVILNFLSIAPRRRIAHIRGASFFFSDSIFAKSRPKHPL
jgi:hypothetical protein